MQPTWLECMAGELQARGYGEKRQAELLSRFKGLSESFRLEGAADPETLAATRVLNEIEQRTREKARMAYDTLTKFSQIDQHFASFNYNAALLAGDKQATPATAAKALLTPDARSRHLNIDTLADVYKGQLWAAMADVVDRMGKGLMGVQKGKAHMDNVVDEVFGKNTGDTAAKQIAESWTKGANMVVDLWNEAGGVMHKLDRWGLPQLQSIANLVKNGGKDGATWIAEHMNWLDWDRMRWPNGAPIKIDERQGILEEVFKTLVSDGANKIDPRKFNGRGAAVGDAVDNHRFLLFKDGDSWRAMHEKYGDGSVFDVMTAYVADVSHKMAMVRILGSNPRHMLDTVKAMALKRAAAIGPRVVQQTKAELQNSFDPLAEYTLRLNSMDPESTMANVVTGAGNMITAAVLNSAVLAAIPGDFATTMTVRAMNKLPVLDGLVGAYAKNLSGPTEAARLATQSGFVVDEAIHSIFSKSRFSGIAEHGPAWTKRLSDVTLRLSGMNVHTNALRWVNQAEMMGAMAANAGKAFDDVPFKAMMQKYGITSDHWDALRGLTPWQPYPGVDRLRPSDILNSTVTGTSGKQEIYERFQSMILGESRLMVPASTGEAAVTLKGNTRADTLPGALLHSFAMYKNFPITLALMYGRVAMNLPNAGGRMQFYAGMGASLILAGAVGVQLREMAKGRDPLPMDGAAFWGKSLLASGAMSIWGDFLFQGVNRIGQGPVEAAAGPITGLLGDTTQLAFGKMFKFADEMGTLKADKLDKSTPFAALATEYASRYTPGTSIWWGRAALQRELFDPLRAIADPRGVLKMDRRERQRVKDFGNTSWWEPGATAPHRFPGLPAGVQ